MVTLPLFLALLKLTGTLLAIDGHGYNHYQQHAETNGKFLSKGIDASEIKPNEVIMEVHGIVCSFCSQGVKKKLKKFTFIDRSRLNKGISMNVKNQRITIAIKPGETVDMQGMFKAILDGGYEPISALIADKQGNVRSVRPGC